MRGPSQTELLDAWLHHLAGQASPRHFHDALAPGRRPPAGITGAEFDTARRLMHELMPRDDDAFRRWFAAFVTEPKPGFEVLPVETDMSPGELQTKAAAGMSLRRHPWARFASIQLQDDRGSALCAQGECFDAPPDLAPAVELLAAQRHLDTRQLLSLPRQDLLWPWLGGLYHRGLLLLDD